MNIKKETDKVTKIQKIKKHFKNHQRDYIIAAATAATTTVITTTAIAITAKSNSTAPMIQQLLNFGPTNACVINLTERSCPSKPVHLVGTNLYFDSLHDAARKTGYHLSRISQNVNGKIPDVNGEVFELLTPA